jgi:GntR family transcriptional regulator
MKDKPVRQESLAFQVLNILSERIDNGQYPSNSQLPAESVLVEEFEVSRATIRRALDILETNGKVIRRHGIGSFVSAATKINNPINEPILFQTLIKNSGHQPGILYVKSKLSTPKPEIALALKISESDEVIEFHKVFTADGEKVIYLVNTIPLYVVGESKENILSNPNMTEPIFTFFEESCDQKLIYYICELKVDIMANCPCDCEINDGAEIALVFDEVGHNQDDVPILHSIHYYPGNRMKFELVRRRLG